MALSHLIDDDFIFTVSDHEDLSLSEEDLAAPNNTTIEGKSSLGKKRKRTNEKEEPHKKLREINKITLTNTKKNEKVHEDVSSSAEEDWGQDDGTIDPDFEFDIGGTIATGIIEDFDFWGDNTGSGSVKEIKGNKKGVDIDDIIARRAAKKANVPEESNVSGHDESLDLDVDDALDEVASEDVNDLDEAEFPNFEDDELLATDVFGGGAKSEDEGAQDQDEGTGSEARSNLDSKSEVNSDDDSVASPTAHPDDAFDDSDTDSQASAPDKEEVAKRAAFFSETPSSATVQGSNSFTSFSLSRPILRALTNLSFHNPTPIQSRSIPLALAGHDLVGSAVTGSGKTAAFLLPILERLLYRPRRIPTTRVAVLVPTRELAVQCHAVAIQLAKYTDITFALVVGGFSLREQEMVLKTRPDVVIATPGRFIDHMRNSASFAVENIEILVLDEADRMLEDGFADELDEILKSIPKSRQTMLFSATMTDQVDKLVRVGMSRPVRVSVDKKKSTTGGLVQEFVRLRSGKESLRLATLALLCSKVFKERTIVFFRQKKEAHRVRIVFGLLGIKAGELHGSMSQEQRIAAVESFRDGRTTHMLATDLASRGLDIKNVMSVVNYEAPQSHEIYVHRVGRTARAGREGRACTIAAEPDRKVVKAAVKSARAQGAGVVSRILDAREVDAMKSQIDDLEADIEEIMAEEKEEKQLAQAETQLTRGENLVKHEAEILARPKRTWFESEKEKRIARKAGMVELNGVTAGKKGKGKGGKLSGKDKKRLDDYRERTEGTVWRKGKGSEEASKAERRERGKKMKAKRAKGGVAVGRSAGAKKRGGEKSKGRR